MAQRMIGRRPFLPVPSVQEARKIITDTDERPLDSPSIAEVLDATATSASPIPEDQKPPRGLLKRRLTGKLPITYGLGFGLFRCDNCRWFNIPLDTADIKKRKKCSDMGIKAFDRPCAIRVPNKQWGHFLPIRTGRDYSMADFLDDMTLDELLLVGWRIERIIGSRMKAKILEFQRGQPVVFRSKEGVPTQGVIRNIKLTLNSFVIETDDHQCVWVKATDLLDAQVYSTIKKAESRTVYRDEERAVKKSQFKL